MSEAIENIGEMVDTIDNLIAATSLPMTPQFHLENLIENLRDLREKARETYIALGGDDEWK